jgi:hypothetical protein
MAIAGFLVMNPDPIHIDEARVLRVKYNLTTLDPLSIAWTQE